MTQFRFEDLPAPGPLRRLNLDIGEVAVVEDGPLDGPPVLLIHGLGEHLGYWTETLPALAAQGMRVVAPELPGFGRSVKPTAPYSLSWQVAQIGEICDQTFGPGVKPLLVGHSMGGHIGLLMGLIAPERLGGLLLLAPAGIERFTGREAAMLKMAATPQMYAALTPDLLRADYQRRLFGIFNEAAEARLRERIASRKAEGFMDYARAVSWGVAAMLDEPVAGRLAREGLPDDLPVQILLGGADRMIPNRTLHRAMTGEDVAAEIRRLMPRCDLQILEGVGHMLQLEAPTQVNEAIVVMAQQIEKSQRSTGC